MALKEGLYKASGYYGKYKAVMSIIVGIILIIIGIGIGIYLGIISPQKNAIWFSLIMIVFGIFSIFYGWILWRRCNALVQGRFW